MSNRDVSPRSSLLPSNKQVDPGEANILKTLTSGAGKKSDCNPVSEDGDWEMYTVPWEPGVGATSPICVGQRQQAETKLRLTEWVGVCQCGHCVSQADGMYKGWETGIEKFIGKGLFFIKEPLPPSLPDPFPQLPNSSALYPVGFMLLPPETACSSPNNCLKKHFYIYQKSWMFFQMLTYHPSGDCLFWTFVYFSVVCLINIYLYHLFTYPGQ